MTGIPAGREFGDNEFITVGNDQGEPDDAFDIVLVDDDDTEREWSPEGGDAPLRGQNETPGDDVTGSIDGAEPADFDSQQFQDKLNAERRQREDYEAQVLQQQERTEYALVEAEKRNIAIQADSFKLALDGVDVRIRTTTEALKMARADGDYNAETDLEQQLGELRNIRGQIEANQAKLPDPAQLDHDFQRHVHERRQRIQSTRQQSEAPRALNAKAERWQKANNWMGDASKATERQALIEVNNALVAEGYDANQDDFFAELSRRMAKRFPNLGVKSLQGQGSNNGQQARRPNGQFASTPPVAASRSSAPPNPRGADPRQRGRVQLGASDMALLKRLGIDTSDKSAVERYAKEKYTRERQEALARR